MQAAASLARLRGLSGLAARGAPRQGDAVEATEAGTKSQRHCHAVHASEDALINLLRCFWEIEELPRAPALTSEEQKCEEHFAATHTRDADGRYVVRLPLTTNPQGELGESRPVALAALRRLERRLEVRPPLREAYVAFMRDYISRGHMERVRAEAVFSKGVYYLPHHPVVKHQDGAIKVRVVFNASQKITSGRSLNDLYAGPRLQGDLREVLLRWRMHRVAFVADIQQIFRQIRVHSEDYRLQRVLWREGPSMPVEEHQLSTVTYGSSCAPYLAIQVLRQLAQDEQDRYPAAAELLRRSTHVDDIWRERILGRGPAL